MDFKNKKLLLIAPVFYNYHEAIINSLKKLGFDLSFFAERDYSVKRRIKKNINNYYFKKHERFYLENILNEIKDKNFDYILIIRGEIITPCFMNVLKSRYKDAKFYMYQWDSVKNNNYLDILSYFDKVFSFDREDCKKHNINYLPLFYIDEYKNLKSNKTKDIDILMIASALGRDEFLNKLIKFSKDNNLKIYHHLYINRLEYFKGFLNKKRYKNAKFNSLSLKEVMNLYSRSKVIVDFNNINQSGLTIRTFEALGAHKKLITTNKFIKFEDFYDEENIMIIDRENPNIDLDFINKEFKPNKYISNYHIDKFLLNIFNSE